MVETTVLRRPLTAQESVLAQLRRAIAVGELSPGDQIPQASLAERFGTSRVPLREALKILEGEGQVVYRPHRGYVIATLSAAELAEIYTLRELLEREVLARSLPLVTDALLARLEEATVELERAASAGDVGECILANRRFHFMLFDAAGMSRATRMLQLLWDCTDPYRLAYFADPHDRVAATREHRDILDQVRAGDAAGAIARLTAHRDRAARRVNALLVSGTPEIE